MRREEWQAVVEALNLPVCCYPHFSILSKQFGVSVGTLRSIYSQENQRRIVQSSPRLQEQIGLLAHRYCQGENFLDLCCTHNWPPCFLVRRLLEHQPWSLGRQKITEVLRSPDLILEASAREASDSSAWQKQLLRMHSDIEVALLCDPSNAPEADVARRDMGLQYEARLSEGLQALGLAFWTEEALRSKGFFKTPDAKLQVPFLYKGHVIAWIDSKATFGGEYIHQQQMQEQYQKYVNRYGSGMVVYWFGIIDELAAANSSIVLASELPSASAIATLPCLHCKEWMH